MCKRAVAIFGVLIVSLSFCAPHAFAAGTLYVNPDGVCGGNSPCFTTIQAAINAAAPGDQVNVAAGTYVEQLNVNKPLILRGPNSNINPNTGSRTAEATIIPTASDPLNPSFAGPIVVNLAVSGVTFEGFTVDGDNPSLTSGVVFNGADVDAEFGIYGTETANPDAVIRNNIVKNIGEIAVWINSLGQGGAKNANSRITTNKVDNVLGAFGQAIRISDDAWLDVTSNVVTRSRVGIVIENYSGNTTTHPASQIADNNVTSFRIGIRHSLHYVYNAPGFTIRHNTVQPYVQTPLPPQVTQATAYQAIRVESIQQMVFVTVVDNTLNGNRTAMQSGGYTRDEGLMLTNDSNTSPNIVFRINVVQNFIRGAFNETPAVPDFECNTFAGNTRGVYLSTDATTGLIAHNNNIAGNGFGMQNDGPATVDARMNWWGAVNGPGPVGPGSGDNVSAGVDFSNWLTSSANCQCAPPFIISEFRLRGPGGAADEFVEIYNNGNSNMTVSTCDDSAGFALAASDGAARFTIPNGTFIPARAHYLGVNSAGYSLASYPAGGGMNAAGDATYTTDIGPDAGIALFNTSNSASFMLANRLDAAGYSSADALYREGAGFPPGGLETTNNIEYSFYRDLCGFVQGTGCTTAGLPKDTGNNTADFIGVSTDGVTTGGAGQHLGAPAPENLSSPVNRNATFSSFLLDSSKAAGAAPNSVRNPGDTGTNKTLGTLSLRRRFVNNTGAAVTRLRFRIVEITTHPRPNLTTADVRALSSVLVTVSGVTDAATCLAATGSAATPCTVPVQGTTLETPAAQPNGGGYDATLSAGTVTLGTPLAAGASASLQFLLGVEQGGTYRFLVNVEALP